MLTPAPPFTPKCTQTLLQTNTPLHPDTPPTCHPWKEPPSCTLKRSKGPFYASGTTFNPAKPAALHGQREGKGRKEEGRKNETGKKEIRAKRCGAKVAKIDEDEMDAMDDTYIDAMDVYHQYHQHHHRHRHHRRQHQHHHHPACLKAVPFFQTFQVGIT